MRSGKIKPNGIETGGEQFGTTIERSSPARFPNTGKGQKKKGSGSDTIMCGPHGTTFVVDQSHVNMPNAARGAKSSKVIASAEAQNKLGVSETAGSQTASQSGSGAPSQRAYPLSERYGKSGRTDRKSAKL